MLCSAVKICFLVIGLSLVISCKTTNSASKESVVGHDGIGIVDWNSSIISELPMGSALQLKNKLIAINHNLFSIENTTCTILDPNVGEKSRTSKLSKGTTLVLLGQMAGFRINATDTMSGNWLVGEDSKTQLQYGIGCSGNEKRIASAHASRQELETAFALTTPKAMDGNANTAAKSKDICQNNQWVKSFLDLAIGSNISSKVAASGSNQPGWSPSYSLRQGDMVCKLIAGKFRKAKGQFAASLPASTQFKIVGQMSRFKLDNVNGMPSSQCGTGLVLEHTKDYTQFIALCGEHKKATGGLYLPDEEVNMAVLKSVFDISKGYN